MLDGDDLEHTRWDTATTWLAVSNRLHQAGEISLPSEIPPEGFVGEYTGSIGPRVGVWIMPDNVRNASLEAFLDDLRNHNDPLVLYAQESTAKAQKEYQAFQARVAKKAELFAWLAWQQQPGLSYGQAIKEKYFSHEADLACRFVDWVKRLFQLQ